MNEEENACYVDLDTVKEVWDGESFIEIKKIYQLMFDRDDIVDQFFVEDPPTLNNLFTHKVEYDSSYWKEWEMDVWRRGQEVYINPAHVVMIYSHEVVKVRESTIEHILKALKEKYKEDEE